VKPFCFITVMCADHSLRRVLFSADRTLGLCDRMPLGACMYASAGFFCVCVVLFR
jgi:hypothetical protein